MCKSVDPHETLRNRVLTHFIVMVLVYTCSVMHKHVVQGFKGLLDGLLAKTDGHVTDLDLSNNQIFVTRSLLEALQSGRLKLDRLVLVSVDAYLSHCESTIVIDQAHAYKLLTRDFRERFAAVATLDCY